MKPSGQIEFTLNGERKAFDVEPNEKLLELLRRSGYTGTKHGCGEGKCGACTVILDGKAVYACLLYAWQADGREVWTIEGVGSHDAPHPIQDALIEAGAVQCGFCTPGFVMSAKALMDEKPEPCDDDIRMYLDGNLCRCTGYVKIEDAVRRAAGIAEGPAA